MTETKLDPKQFSRTLNFYISDSENGISRVPRDKLVEIQQYIADLDDPKASAAEPVAWQQRERRIGGSEWSNWYPSFKEAYDDFRAGFRSGGKFDYEVRALVPVATPPASASAGEVMVKALEWAGNMASTPFGSYTVCENSDDKWEFTYHSYPYGIADEATFDTEGEAKAASQADFDRRIRSALTAPPATPAVSQGCHPSHKTRMSDASSYDEICVNCGATDTTGGWGALAKPCPATPAVAAARLSIKEWVEETIKNPDKARENLQEIAAMYLADIAVATPAVEITDDMVERLKKAYGPGLELTPEGWKDKTRAALEAALRPDEAAGPAHPIAKLSVDEWIAETIKNPEGAREKLRRYLADILPPDEAAGQGEADWPSDGTCVRCGAAPRNPTNGLCNTCIDNDVATPRPPASDAPDIVERPLSPRALRDSGNPTTPSRQRTIPMADDKGLTRPIIGIDFRTPQEVFDIMMDRIRAAPVARDGWQTSGSLGELSKEERIALDAGMNQWKRSLQRPDMQEKDRVLGAIEAVLRQMFVFSLPAPTAGQHTGEDGK